MAIDSAEKRKSISGIQTFMVAGVTPNATPDQEWRQESGWSYSGIEAGEPAPGVAVTAKRIWGGSFIRYST